FRQFPPCPLPSPPSSYCRRSTRFLAAPPPLTAGFFAPHPTVALPTRSPAARPRPAPASLRRRHSFRSVVAAGGVAADTAQANPTPARWQDRHHTAAAAKLGKNRRVTICGGGVILGLIVFLDDHGWPPPNIRSPALVYEGGRDQIHSGCPEDAPSRRLDPPGGAATRLPVRLSPRAPAAGSHHAQPLSARAPATVSVAQLR
ncbi:unnamed protein product, partial [Urochloa humidicola]